MACMAPHSTCPFFLKVVLVFLPYTVTGNNESIEPSFFPTCCASAEVRSRSAWVAPRMTCVRQRDRKSPPMPTWHAGHAMSPVAYEGRNDGNGAAGNQGTGARGGENQENSSRNSADGGKENPNGSGGGGSSSSSSSNNNGSSGSSSSGGSSVNGGKGGGGGGGGGRKDIAGPSGSAGNPGGGGDGSGTSALERQFAKPAAPRNGGLSEGLGKGTPSPSQRLQLQQENLEMRWRMAKKRDSTVCCRQCAGEGVIECRFCAGTGLFKIGSDLIVHPTSGRPPPCPVCKSKGEEVCTRCKGAGRIAAWLLRSERSGGLSGDRG